MGVYIRKIHGDEYIYILAGKKQFFLGRKDTPEDIDLKNLHKATSIIDKNFDKMIEKYLKNLDELVQYLSVSDRQKYLANRKHKFFDMLQYFKFK